MQALKFLLEVVPYLPMHLNGNMPQQPSNSEVRRWLQNRSVIINGSKPTWDDEIEFPVNQLVFFPKNAERRVTMV